MSAERPDFFPVYPMLDPVDGVLHLYNRRGRLVGLVAGVQLVAPEKRYAPAAQTGAGEFFPWPEIDDAAPGAAPVQAARPSEGPAGAPSAREAGK